jgi:hypothetical protein
LRIYRNFIVVAEGQFGDSARENFILDTGTAPSIVNTRLVKKLSLTPIPATMSVIGKMIVAKSAILPEVRLGPVLATAFRVQLEDLSPLERTLGMPIAGILGMDVLSQSSFVLDYDKKLLVFGEALEQGIAVPFDAQNKLAVASVKVNGKPERMLVDSGSDQVALLGVNLKDVSGTELHNTAQEGSNVEERPVPVKVSYGPDIVLGGQHFSVQKAYFVPGNTEPRFDGLLGVRALGFHAMAYSREREVLYLQK